MSVDYVNYPSFEMLKTFGLTSYQIRAYLTIVSNLSVTASELAKESSIPRTKIYVILDGLIEKGWIEKLEGRPIRYRAKPPLDVLNQKKQEFLTNFDYLRDDLEERWNLREDSTPKQIEILFGEKVLRSQTLQLIKKAKNQLVLFFRFIFEDEISSIIKSLQLADSNGIFIRIYLFPEIHKKLTSEELTKLQKIAQVNVVPIPSRIIICDSEDMILSIPSVYQHSSDPTLIQSVYFKTPGLIKMVENSLRSTMELTLSSMEKHEG